MNFMGPHSRLDLRLDKNEQPLPSSTPVNKSVSNSYIHDLKYKHAKEDYLKDPTPENKKRQMQKIWQADDNFIRDMNNDHEEPMAKVAGKLIQAKETAEKLGASTTFSGFGTSEEPENSDPVARLRLLAQQEYKAEVKKRQEKGSERGFYSRSISCRCSNCNWK